MTQYLYGITQLIDTFEAIDEHQGKNMTGIAKATGWTPIIARIREFEDYGLVKLYDVSRREVYITEKGRDVYNLLKQVNARLCLEQGADEYCKESITGWGIPDRWYKEGVR